MCCGRTQTVKVNDGAGNTRVVERRRAVAPVGYEVSVNGRTLRYMTKVEAQAAADKYGLDSEPRPVFS